MEQYVEHESSFDSHNILLDHLQTVYQPFKISTTMFSFVKVSAIVALVFAASTAEAAEKERKAAKGECPPTPQPTVIEQFPTPEPFSSNNQAGIGIGTLYGQAVEAIATEPDAFKLIMDLAEEGALLAIASTMPPGEEQQALIEFAIRGPHQDNDGTKKLCDCNDGYFCNYDGDGGDYTGNCEPCSWLSISEDCYNDGLPFLGAADCARRCFPESQGGS